MPFWPNGYLPGYPKVKKDRTSVFSRVLIANRGEIACRIRQTCHRLGIKTIAVGSTADQNALHMQLADTAVVIGSPEVRDSYLNIEAILQAALQHGAEAIHPGYGFLSENPEFASRVREAGLVFIGPPTEAIQAMGSKAQAKAIAKSVNVPVIPGYEGEGDLLIAACQVGFPLLIKATYGGGGKGMRRVNSANEFNEAFAACQREALSAFGNGQMMLEKYIERPRHVEVQILADRHGNCLALSDRDCSLQRRHQKVIEEAPAPYLSAELRHNLQKAAVDIAKFVTYEGVGTVEFLVTGAAEFFFLEMNTRLQVEHPVTEMVLNLDLVEWQLRVAAGEPLTLDSKECQAHGHAIEARLYAEDGDDQFLPSTGTLTQFNLPIGENIRVDTGIRKGDAVTIYYDPMIAKITAWGKSREAALKGLTKALLSTEIKGIKTNLNFLKRLLAFPNVREGTTDIGFIDRYVEQEGEGGSPPEEAYIMAALWLHKVNSSQGTSPWTQQDGWRLNTSAIHHFYFANGVSVSLALTKDGWRAKLKGKDRQFHQAFVSEENSISAKIGNISYHAQVAVIEEEIHIYLNGRLYRLKQRIINTPEVANPGINAHLIAPMPGRVVSVLVTLDETVETGQPLIILEAMKMEHTIRAPYDGIVDHLPFAPGDFCEEGVELLRLERGVKK
jgi:3-methylcrotonyl-CoA carboxylase alpha subunit